MSLPTFAVFFEAVHGYAPFPWQVRAAQALARREALAVAVPTGLGKSAMVDAAIWAAAQGTWRRIAFVVDRRIVVDAVHERARLIEQRLAAADSAVLAAVGARVGPMQVVRLRGGVFGDDDWVLYPERLTVALTTVDQLGSRLLFRGYGVSSRRWPLHAGFFGSDTLVIVDEAHLSQPFLQTLDALRAAGAGIAVLPMSATLAMPPAGKRIALDAQDLALPVVQRRMQARKAARVVEIGAADAAFVPVAVAQVVELSRKPGVTCVALVVNRVATARRSFERLRASGVDSVLLTGRTRPADRDARLASVLPRVDASRSRSAADTPLVVVATQTIEVGADFDFDALVTEGAPLSSLRQRFGRVDRLGLRGRSEGVLLLRAAAERDDPVYGTTLPAAVAWLRSRAQSSDGVVDFGLDAFDRLLAAHPPPDDAVAHAATLLPTHLQMLAQTGPFAPDLDLSAWLHGASDRAPDVTLVWRDDLPADAPQAWPIAVSLLPPMLREGLAMPVAAVRRWLCGSKAGDEWSDQGSAADDSREPAVEGRPVLRWRGPDDCVVVEGRDIRPGDTLVLPAAYGGCDAWGWAPESTVPVDDLADTCLAERLEAGAARRVVLRLADGHWGAFGDAAGELEARSRELLALQAEAATSEDDLEDAMRDAEQRLLDAVRVSGHPLAASLVEPRVDRHPGGLVIRGAGIEERDGAIETGRAVALDVHHDDVARWAGRLADADPHREEIVAAAAAHDAGKREPRMQALLHGSALKAAAGPVIAKSALRRRDQQLAAWLASTLPRGFRHEFATLDFVPVADALTRHLVATHHGFGRPWLAPCEDTGAAGAHFAHLGSPWRADWAAMVSDHGPWAVARMEWLLRAADARASMEEAADASR